MTREYTLIQRDREKVRREKGYAMIRESEREIGERGRYILYNNKKGVQLSQRFFVGYFKLNTRRLRARDICGKQFRIWTVCEIHEASLPMLCLPLSAWKIPILSQPPLQIENLSVGSLPSRPLPPRRTCLISAFNLETVRVDE